VLQYINLFIILYKYEDWLEEKRFVISPMKHLAANFLKQNAPLSHASIHSATMLATALVAAAALGAANAEDYHLTMPGVDAKLPKGETYLCSAAAVAPDELFYVTAIEPLVADLDAVHHLMLVGCGDPTPGGHAVASNVWNCGGSLGEAGLVHGNVCHTAKQGRRRQGRRRQ